MFSCFIYLFLFDFYRILFRVRIWSTRADDVVKLRYINSVPQVQIEIPVMEVCDHFFISLEVLQLRMEVWQKLCLLRMIMRNSPKNDPILMAYRLGPRFIERKRIFCFYIFSRGTHGLQIFFSLLNALRIFSLILQDVVAMRNTLLKGIRKACVLLCVFSDQ